MGNDGGSIPRRNEMVREKQKENNDTKHQVMDMYFFCQLSKEPLREPIVGDGLGRLYNKDAAIEYLLSRKTDPTSSKKIEIKQLKSLKDVKELKLEKNPNKKDKNTSNSISTKSAILSHDEQRNGDFICPLSMKEMNGIIPFEFTWTCGCVVSTSARVEMANSDIASCCCVVCSKPCKKDDIIPINSVDEKILDTLMSHVKERRRLAKESKKAKRKHDDMHNTTIAKDAKRKVHA